MVHHLHWWRESSSWWKDVHPLLVGKKVRAVIGGDYGPTKYSYREADGVQYVHAAVAAEPGLEMLRTSEKARVLNQQMDCFLHFEVDDAGVRFEVRTVGSKEPKHSPGRFDSVHEMPVADYVYYSTWQTSRRRWEAGATARRRWIRGRRHRHPGAVPGVVEAAPPEIELVTRVHAVDGTYELFRNYFGAPEAVNAEGVEVGATRGLLRTLASLVKQPDVTHVAVAFDTVIESFRNELFEGYKTGDRHRSRAVGAVRASPSSATARRSGMVVWSMIDFEADDALATAAAALG